MTKRARSRAQFRWNNYVSFSGRLATTVGIMINKPHITSTLAATGCWCALLSSPAIGGIATWPFSVPADYAVSDTAKIEIVGGIARLIPVDQTDDDGTPTGFAGGTHSQTGWDAANGWLELVGGVTSGQFTSRVMDVGASAAWESVLWTPRVPYLKELPNLKRTESAYSTGNADMTGNVFLAHFNESPISHGGSVPDSSGEVNDGILFTGEGASDKSAGGKLGGALSFDGVDDYVVAPDASSLDILSAITMEAWIESSAGGGAVGEISPGIIDFYEYDLTHGRDPDIVHVSGDIYAIAYGRRWDDNDGWLFTIAISSDGTVAAGKADNLEFDNQSGIYPKIVHVSGDVYAISYSGPGEDGWLKTVQVADDGTIGGAPIDSLEFDTVRCLQSSIVHVSGDVYAIAYTGNGTDGWLVTVQIAPDGTIGGSTIDSLEFDGSRGSAPELIHVSDDVYAIAYSGPGTDGWLVTLRISGDGSIGDLAIDGMEFDMSNCLDPDIVRVAGDTYAIAYSGTETEGWMATVRIAADGTLGPGPLDTAEFEPTYALTPHIVHIARDVYAIAYGGPGEDGWIVTNHIAADGTIGAVADAFEFDGERGTDPRMIHIAGDIYAVACSGPDHDGSLCSLEILTERGIVKAGAYGVDSDTAGAFAWINDEVVSAGITAGWNHIALVYDKDAAADQQGLYVNGSLARSNSLAESIEVNSSPLMIGKRLSGKIDEVAIFDHALSPAEIADHYKRGALRLKYQVRSGSSDPPAGPFLGPDGTTSTYYSELSNRTAGLPSLALAGAGAGRYFQYKAYFETDDVSCSPELESVLFGPAHYPGDNPTVQSVAGQMFTSLVSFTETLGPGNDGGVRYQISNDGPGWYYWNGSNWAAAAGYSQTNTAAEISVNCGQFEDDVGDGDFYFKAFLHSDSASERVELDQIDLSFAALIISVSVDNSIFAFGTRTLNTWLVPDSTVIANDGTVPEDFLGKVSRFDEGIETWGISVAANGNDVIRAQWSTAGAAGPWTDISAYDSGFTIETNVAVDDSVTLWFRIMTPTSTSSFNQYSSTLTVTAREF